MLKRLQVFGVATAATLVMAAAASAAPIIDFQGPAAAGGSMVSSGGNIVGTNIPIATVFVDGFSSGNGSYSVIGTASATAGGVTTSTYGDLDFNTTTGAITISGCVVGLNIGFTGPAGACDPTTQLMTGTITGFMDLGVGILITSGIDTKPAFASALGFPSNMPFSMAMSISTGPNFTSGSGTAASSTDIRNVPVPEPATMMLLGTGLLAAFRARRRKA